MADYFLEPASPEFSHTLINLFPVSVATNGHNTPPHMHPAAEMLYFVSGQCTVRVGKTYQTAKSGDLVLFRGNTVHGISLLSEEAAHYHVIMIHPSLVFSTFSGESMQYPMSFLSARPNDTAILRDLCDATKRIIEDMLPLSREEESTEPMPLRYPHLRAKGSDLLISLVQNELRENLPDSQSTLPDEKIVKQIYENLLYIDDCFDQPISPIDCAARLHMSYSCYAKRFSQVTGRSFKQYLFDCRMSHAESMLLSSDLPVTEVAIRCGYSSVSHFISEFRRYKGTSPLNFRKSMRE